MIRKLIKIAQHHDIAPGEALEVHVAEAGPCENCHGYDAVDAHHVANVQNVCPLSDFVDRWATDASEHERLQSVARLPASQARPWLAIVHDTGILLVRLFHGESHHVGILTKEESET